MTPPSATVAASAVISDCGRYRYRLERRWGAGPACVFIMLNPSTADSCQDDPTIRKCMRFAQALGNDALVVVNLFAWRATDPKELLQQPPETVVGPENDEHIRREALGGGRLIAAWGAHGRHLNRDVEVLRKLGVSATIFAFGFNKNGTPVHPLYQKNGARPELWKR